MTKTTAYDIIRPPLDKEVTNMRWWHVVGVIIIGAGLGGIIVSNALEQSDGTRQRRAAKAAAIQADVARIAAADPKEWSRMLVGKPGSDYFPRLGLRAYHPDPDYAFGAGGQIVVTNDAGLMWLVIESRGDVWEMDGP